jgi:hypothetical protein
MAGAISRNPSRCFTIEAGPWPLPALPVLFSNFNVDIALSRRADLILVYSPDATGITIISALWPPRDCRPRRTTITRPSAAMLAAPFEERRFDEKNVSILRKPNDLFDHAWPGSSSGSGLLPNAPGLN